MLVAPIYGGGGASAHRHTIQDHSAKDLQWCFLESPRAAPPFKTLMHELPFLYRRAQTKTNQAQHGTRPAEHNANRP